MTLSCNLDQGASVEDVVVCEYHIFLHQPGRGVFGPDAEALPEDDDKIRAPLDDI